MNPTQITFHDLRYKLPGGRSLSPFTALVRYVLNYKELEFKTEWRTYTDIEAVAKAIGAKPTGQRNGAPKYTVPILVDETHSTRVVISDSMAIIQYLEKAYPDPQRSLLPPDPDAPAQHLLAMSAISKIVLPLFRPILLPGFYELVPDEAKATWLSVYTGGKPPQSVALAPESAEYKDTIEKTKESLISVASFLEKQSGNGIWFGGDRPVYIDFATVAFLNMIRLTTPGFWVEIAGIDGGRFDQMVQACEQYARL